MAKYLRRGVLFLGASAGLVATGVAGRIGYMKWQDNPLPEVPAPKLVNVGGWALDVSEDAEVN